MAVAVLVVFLVDGVMLAQTRRRGSREPYCADSYRDTADIASIARQLQLCAGECGLQVVDGLHRLGIVFRGACVRVQNADR